MNYFKSILLVSALAVITASCEPPTSPKNQPIECNISITSDVSSIEKGSSKTLNANITSNKDKGECSQVYWESKNPDIASVNENGKVTGKKAGNTTIKACISGDKSKKCDIAKLEIFTHEIAFLGSIDASYNVFLSTKDGKYEKNITKCNYQCTDPAWSPDGEKIAYVNVSEGNAYSINPDGTGRKNLTPRIKYIKDPAWSPDGESLIGTIKVNNDDPFEIRTINLTTGQIRRLTFENIESGKTPGAPDWSPDGEKIAYNTNKDGNWEIYLMNADGSNKINLTQAPESSEGMPEWSPDGEKIAFSSHRSGEIKIYVMNADGSNVTAIPNAKGGGPEWSPDGEKIIFKKNDEMFKINLDGTQKEKLKINDVPFLPGKISWRPKTE